MKVLSEKNQSAPSLPLPAANNFELPYGLIGFKEYTRAELLYVPDHLPFFWLKLYHNLESVNFIVIEPGGLVPDYAPELFDADVEALDLKDPGEAMVLNIVTLKHQNPLEATINLVGPIIINRRTRLGRQLVVANYQQYSAHWALVDQTGSDRATA